MENLFTCSGNCPENDVTVPIPREIFVYLNISIRNPIVKISGIYIGIRYGTRLDKQQPRQEIFSRVQ